MPFDCVRIRSLRSGKRFSALRTFAHLLLVLLCLGCLSNTRAAGTPEPIRIGVISSFSKVPEPTRAYANALRLVVDRWNIGSGLLGRKIELLERDDAGDPATAVRLAQELVLRDHVVALTGTYLDNVTMGVSEFARHQKVLFVSLGATDQLTWEKGNPYTFIVQQGMYGLAKGFVEAAAKLPAKRWATVAPNYVFGRDTIAMFRKQLKAARPDVEFVAEQWPTFGKIDAGPVVQALAHAKPDAIFSALFGSDNIQFVREGTKRGLFDQRTVFSLIMGFPEELRTLGAETPVGWVCSGYPWRDIHTPEHEAFVREYQSRFGALTEPTLSAVWGWLAGEFLLQGIKRAGTVEADPVAATLRGMTIASPFGPITMRPLDQRSTLGLWIGTSAVVNGKGVMKDWQYLPGERYMPPDEEVRKLRPADSSLPSAQTSAITK